jgi:hypothetical protein
MAPALLKAVSLALRASAAACPLSPTCPQNDKCAYTTVASSVTFQVNCATDFYGEDLKSTQASLHCIVVVMV